MAIEESEEFVKIQRKIGAAYRISRNDLKTKRVFLKEIANDIFERVLSSDERVRLIERFADILGQITRRVGEDKQISEILRDLEKKYGEIIEYANKKEREALEAKQKELQAKRREFEETQAMLNNETKKKRDKRIVEKIVELADELVEGGADYVAIDFEGRKIEEQRLKAYAEKYQGKAELKIHPSNTFSFFHKKFAVRGNFVTDGLQFFSLICEKKDLGAILQSFLNMSFSEQQTRGIAKYPLGKCSISLINTSAKKKLNTGKLVDIAKVMDALNEDTDKRYCKSSVNFEFEEIDLNMFELIEHYMQNYAGLKISKRPFSLDGNEYKIEDKKNKLEVACDRVRDELSGPRRTQLKTENFVPKPDKIEALKTVLDCFVNNSIHLNKTGERRARNEFEEGGTSRSGSIKISYEA